MSRRRSRRHSEWPLHLALGLGALVMVFPFVWQALGSLKSASEIVRMPPTLVPGAPTVEGYRRFFATVPFWRMLATTVGATLLRVVGQVAVSALAGYAFARLRFPGKNILFMLFLAMLMVPGQLFLITQFKLVRDLGLLNSLPALALPGIFTAFGTFLMRQAFSNIPVSYEESARLDGANPLQVFWHVMLPLTAPSLTALAVLTGLFGWNDLLWPLIVTQNPDRMPLSVGLAGLQGQYGTDYPTLMAGSLICSLPLVIVFLAMQRQFFSGIASSGIKG